MHVISFSLSVFTADVIASCPLHAIRFPLRDDHVDEDIRLYALTLTRSSRCGNQMVCIRFVV